MIKKAKINNTVIGYVVLYGIAWYHKNEHEVLKSWLDG